MSALIALPLNAPTGVSTRPGAGPRLVVDTPIVAVVEAITEDLSRLRRVELTGGTCRSLEHYYTRLYDAQCVGLQVDARALAWYPWFRASAARRHTLMGAPLKSMLVPRRLFLV